ncbi:bromodomain and WD repeat-containing protein 3-like [Daphnia carinata]|uniref:bromodomain and WD repeat-containing protein 3-like n=1 Tax=Daphnia carinata TaxID=120202 RepID=UPI00258037F2|nr:bromodomain and WD repeat-containing protein 3-like [Daphnia carinata]XP_057378099.1 bromodomain and WD repeat-containing protein 3-like [Daphnia carinata]
MTNECCIPNCSNGQKGSPVKHTLFWVPKDYQQRKKWENIIPRKGQLKQTHRVCALHFHDQDIIKGKTVIINGKKDFYQCHPMQWKLREGAIPRIFPVSTFDYISQSSPRYHNIPTKSPPPTTPQSAGRRSTRSTAEDDAGSSKRIRIYSYDFENNLSGRLPEYEESDPETSGSSFSSDYSDWTAETSEALLASIPTKHSKKGLPHSFLVNSDLNLTVPEILRPSDMRTPVVPCRAPYYPQMGDEVIYFRQGHELYADAINQKKLLDLHSSLPWANEQEVVKIIGIKFDIKPPNRLYCLKLQLLGSGSGQETKSEILNGSSFTVKYHHVDGVPDFLVLKQHYDSAILRNWQPGERFHCLKKDSWREGHIEQREPFSAHCPNSVFLCYCVRWENGEVERLSPWDLHEIKKKPRGRPKSVTKNTVPTEDASVLYKPQIEDWPPEGNRDCECDRISAGISKIMNLSAAKHFAAPVDLDRYPLYVFVIKYPPMDLSTIKARLDNRFYRRLTAVQYDVRSICSNAFKFNVPKSDIVRNASIVADLCLEMIRNRDSADVITTVYQQLVEKYATRNEELVVESAIVSNDEYQKHDQTQATVICSKNRLDSHSNLEEEILHENRTSKTQEKKMSASIPNAEGVQVTPSSIEETQSSASSPSAKNKPNPVENSNFCASCSAFPRISCACAIDVSAEDKTQLLNEKQQLDLDVDNRFRTLMTTIEPELRKEKKLLAEQKQKIIALRAALSLQRHEETNRSENQWPEVIKLARLIEEREKIHGQVVLHENQKLTQEMAFLEQQINAKKLQMELNLLDVDLNPQQFRSIEKKLQDSKQQARQMEFNLKPANDELSRLEQKEKDIDRQISELKSSINNLLATMEVMASSIQNQITNLDTKKKDIVCNLKERIHASRMVESKLIKISYQEAIIVSQKKAEGKLNKLDRLVDGLLELNDTIE